MRKCQGVAPRGPEKCTSIFKNVSKVSAILLIMVVVQPYRFVAAIPDANEIVSSKIGPRGYNYGGGSPGLLHTDLGGQDLLLPLKPDVSGKHTIGGVGGKIGHESKDKLGMDESMKEFDNEFNDASNAFDRRKTRKMREMRSICASGTTRFVKVSLSGSNKVLSLAEVQVFTMIDGSETNVALSSNGASAEQSSTLDYGIYDASKAIDGSTDQSNPNITHTQSESNPWWEVELKESYDVTKIVVWNRQDCCSERLSQASVSILDADKKVQATFQLPKEPENPGEGSKGPIFTFILPQSCTLIEGTYHTRQESNSGTRPWWAFKPSTCPAGGCPLFFWIDGTSEEDFKEERQQIWLTEMFNRGYVAATVDYAASAANFGGCHGTLINGNVGVVDKAKDMFDKDDSDSVINQLCNKSYVNCDGIAVAGFSQGSQIAALASDFDDRVSAALLYGSGNNVNSYLVVNARQHCMDTIKLPKQRRRYFSGDNDNLFYKNDYTRGRRQLIEMSHYDDCESSERPDSCLQHEPPVTADPYTGGSIDNTGGYYIIKNGHHGQFMEWSNFTGTLVDFNKNNHLDWLDRTARITKPTLEQVQTSVTLTIDQEHRSVVGELSAQGIFFEWAANVNDMGVLGRRHVVGSEANTLDTTDFSHVPTYVIGFRLSARTHDAALVDRLDIKTNDGQIFKKLSFERNNYDAFCFSVVPERDWDQCLGGISHLCIDFCTNGEWYSCTKSFMGNESSGPEEESEEFSKCPISTESEHEVKITFDLDHRSISGEHTDSFLVHFADIDGQLGQTQEVRGNQNRVEKVFSGVSNSSPGFRVRATLNDAMFIDMLAVVAQGVVLDGLTFEQNNYDGYCLGTDAGKPQYGSRCWENTIFRCIDFCADGDVIGVRDEDCMDPTSSPITCWTSKSPSAHPSTSPSKSPSAHPSTSPSKSPSAHPSTNPSKSPIAKPSTSPSLHPSTSPSKSPSAHPSTNPSESPIAKPSTSPSLHPSTSPRESPSAHPSTSPSESPSAHPSTSPSESPSAHPSTNPSESPIAKPSTSPSVHPSTSPSKSPSTHPSTSPRESLSGHPSTSPSESPSNKPSTSPRAHPSTSPSESPSAKPSTTPSKSPIAPISTDVWRIVFTGLDANFTAISDTELLLKYDIGKNPTSNGSAAGRYKTKLYAKDCRTELPTSGAGPLLFNLTDNGRITKSPGNDTFDKIKLMYKVNKTAIATSSVWNSTAKEIEVCQEVQLIEDSVTLGEMVIVEAKRIVSIEFNLDVNILLGVDLGEGTVELASGTTGVDDYVTAYKCDENFNQDNSPLIPNEKLLVCIESNSTDVKIKEIETMTLTQVGATNMPVIVNSTISSPQITGNRIVSSIKQVISTRVPINLFTFANDQSIDVEGKVIMQLDGSRRLQANSATGGAEAAAFAVKVTLQPEAALADGVQLHSSASIASRAFISLGVALAMAAW